MQWIISVRFFWLFLSILLASDGAQGRSDLQAIRAGSDARVTRISEIQGNGPRVAVAAEVHVRAIVTALFRRKDQFDGFFMQEEVSDWDENPATSEGIFVYCHSLCPSSLAPGDRVSVKGEAMDFYAMSQIRARQVGIESRNHPLPEPVPVCLSTNEDIPLELRFEQVEGMLVRFDQKLVVSEHYKLARFGQVSLIAGERPHQFTQLYQPDPQAYAEHKRANRYRTIFLDDDNDDWNESTSSEQDRSLRYPSGGLDKENRFRTGDSISGLTGVMHWSWNGDQRDGQDWRIRPVSDEFDIVFAAENPMPDAPLRDTGTLRIVSMNLMNYFTTLDIPKNTCGPLAMRDCRGADSERELLRQREKIVAAVLALDAQIIGVVEIENNEAASLRHLVDGLNERLGAKIYDFVHTGVLGSDVIKVGFLFQLDFVSPVEDWAVLDSEVDLRLDDTKNRPVLIQSFQEVKSGERITLALAHLKSKGSDCEDDPDRGDGQGNCPETRRLATLALADLLAKDPTGSRDPDFLIIGDLNAYAREDAIAELEAAGYVNIVSHFIGRRAYSYVFDSQLGYLDHALASSSLASQVADVSIWHINADEINFFDYNDEVLDEGEKPYERKSSARPLYEPNASRFSDHDPVIVDLWLGRNSGKARIESEPFNRGDNEQPVQERDWDRDNVHGDDDV